MDSFAIPLPDIDTVDEGEWLPLCVLPVHVSGRRVAASASAR